MKMKHYLYLGLLCLAVTWSCAQDRPLGAGSNIKKNPAHWTYTVSKSQAKVGEVVELIIKGTIDEGWYTYSKGPFETAPEASFTFAHHASYALVGNVVPVHDKKKNDEYLGEYRYFIGEAEYRQKVKILAEKPEIKLVYEYFTCSAASGQCLPPFEEEVVFGPWDIQGKVETPIETPSTPKPNEKKTISVPVASTSGAIKSDPDTAKAAIEPTLPNSDTAAIVTASQPIVLSTKPADASLWGFMVAAFLAGLAALLTPCVFPIIPMTVTFFTRKNSNRSKAIGQALLYGFSIILIYTLIGTVVAKVAGPEAANFLSTHWFPNLFFFVVFIVFSASFLGMFDIVLPNWLVNKVDAESEKGGIYGIFFMAFTLVLVSFSCTGPIVGTILVESAGGQFIKPIAGMFAFSLALALPFTLFAIFPHGLANLPKSGGWLNTVKVTLGFLELALSLKFLSIADQVYHWRILDREVFLALWITIFGVLGVYLLGKIRLPHDDETPSIGVPRAILAILVLSFVVYMIPGLFGAPLKVLSGYLPPASTQSFSIGANQNSTAPVSNTLCDTPKYADLFHLPHGLQGYFDLNQAKACAKKQGKPIFVDFTGHGCVNCREMEANVWSDPKVLTLLQNEFVLSALYVDDKTELPKNEWYTSPYDQKVKSSIGKQNADMEIRLFGNNAQPYYILLDENGESLVEPTAYDLNPQHFESFLKGGLEAYKKKKAGV